MGRLLCALLTVCIGAGIAKAQDEPNDWPVRAEVVPVERLSAEARQALRTARLLDYAYVEPASGNQKGAIEAYKRYLALAPANEPVSTLAPMSRICYLYANTYDTGKGETYHFDKASDWSRRVLKLADAHGIVSVEITDLRKLYMTCTLDRLERVRRIAENYRWHASLTEEDIKRSLADCDKYARYTGGSPKLKHPFPENAERQFRRMLESVRSRCLDKVGETVTYATRVEVLGAISKAFREEDLGRDLWQRVQEKQTRLIDERLDIEQLIDEPSPESDIATGRLPVARGSKSSPGSLTAHQQGLIPRQKTGGNSWLLLTAIGVVMALVSAGFIWAAKLYRGRRGSKG